MSLVVIIDHNDSFTENLARYVRLKGKECEVIPFYDLPRTVDATHLIFSPGPKSPLDYPKTRKFFRDHLGQMPMLGVCLGHQLIGIELGLELVQAKSMLHGHQASINTKNNLIFSGIESPMLVACYNSLVLSGLSADVEVIATNKDKEIMALQHKHYKVFGVQFHPEAILTVHGLKIISNFLEL